MSYCKPVIATRVGGIPELIEDEETGLLVRPGDAGALADKIEKLLGSPDSGREMGGRAAQRVRELFTWEKVADRLRKVYGRVLSEEKG